MDLAPAALRHAREVAAAEGLACRFDRFDVTELPATYPAELGPLAVVTYWFGEFHALPRTAAPPLLARLAAALEPGGLLVLEYQPWDSFPREDDTGWESAPARPSGTARSSGCRNGPGMGRRGPWWTCTGS